MTYYPNIIVSNQYYYVVYEVPSGIFVVACSVLEFFCSLQDITGGLPGIYKNFEGVGGNVICFFLKL